MKHTIIITIFAMWIGTLTNGKSAHSAGMDTSIFSPNVRKVTTSIGFGKGSNCSGLGLCFIITDDASLKDIEPMENKARAMAEYSGNTLSLEFLKASMTPATINKHFGSGQFTINEGTKIEAQVLSPKDAGKFLIIPKGKYTVQDMGRSYQVTFENCMVTS